MKKFIYAACVALASMAMTACSSEEYSGADGNLPVAADYADRVKVEVNQEENTVYCTFESTPGITPIWVSDGAYSSTFTFKKYYRKAGDYTIEFKVKDRNGISDGSVPLTFHIDKTKMNGFAGYDVDSEYNLLKNATFSAPAFWFADASWTQVADPQWQYNANTGEMSVNIATATVERWQGQMSWSTGVDVPGGVKHDFSMIITSNKEIPSLMVKLCQNSEGDPNMMFAKEFNVPAGEPTCLYVHECETIGIADLKVVLDFGGNEAGTEVVMENFVLIDCEHNDVQTPVKVNDEFEYDDPKNVWKAVDDAKSFTEAVYWADDNWAEISHDIISTHNGRVHTVQIPGAVGFSEWQAQYRLENTGLSFAAGDSFNCSLKVSATLNGDPIALPGVTVKITQQDDDNNYLFAVREAVPATGWVFRFEEVKLKAGKDAPDIKFAFDFGGAPKDAVIKIENITVIKR